MRATLFAILATTLPAGLAACHHVAPVAPVEETSPVTAAMKITGSLVYRERIALLPGHVMTVTLSDISIADRAAPVLAEFTRELTGEQVPLAFELTVDPTLIHERMRYAVRGTLRSPEGKLAWTTDTVYPISTTETEQDLGNLNLVRVARVTP